MIVNSEVVGANHVDANPSNGASLSPTAIQLPPTYVVDITDFVARALAMEDDPVASDDAVASPRPLPNLVGHR